MTTERRVVWPDRRSISLCPYCGVGCQVHYHVKDEQLVYADGRDGPANQNRLCVKGRFGFDYIHHPHRLTKPLIRLPRRGEGRQRSGRPGQPVDPFPGGELGGGAGLRCGGPRAYPRRARRTRARGVRLGQGVERGGLSVPEAGAHRVRHQQRRSLHAAVPRVLGRGADGDDLHSGAVSAPFSAALDAEVIVVIGANPTVNHPVAATFIKNAVKQRGAKLIVIDPRGRRCRATRLHHLAFKPGTDVALLNATASHDHRRGPDRPAIRRGLHRGVRRPTRTHRGFPARGAWRRCAGFRANTLREVARLYARARTAIIFWGMGISQHVHGTDNARCLIALALITGQIGRPGTGLHPLRGQNNVQGASDAGLIPMVYPGLSAGGRRRRFASLFEQAWNTALDPESGLTVVEIMDAIHAGTIRGMYVEGENPAMSDPDLNHAREALAKLEHLVVQDLFLTETAFHADVVLPASAFAEKSGTFTNTDRRVQIAQPGARSPGRCAAGLVDHPGDRARIGLDWRYQAPARYLRRDGAGHAVVSTISPGSGWSAKAR